MSKANPVGVANSGNIWLEGLIWGERWDTPGPGTTTLSVYIPSQEIYRHGGVNVKALAPTALELAAIRKTLALFESVIDVDFVETSNIGNADIVFGIARDQYNDGTLGEAFPPGTFFNNRIGDWQSTILVNRANYSAPPESVGQGGYDFVTFIHEFGHALGLAHPHDSGGSSSIFPGVARPFDDFGTHDMNQGVFTTMSYNTGYHTGPAGVSPTPRFGFEGGPMALDIAALQFLYGANTTFARGDDVYVLPTANAPGTFYECIWDTGGFDRIVNPSARDCLIDLRDASLAFAIGGGGFVSQAEGIHGGFSIANGVLIEQAVGGAGDDNLIGNSAANWLNGNAGEDLIRGRAGDDRIDGDAGADTLTGHSGRDSFVYRQASDSSLAGGRDLIRDFLAGFDEINLRHIDANAALAGNQRFDFIGGSGFTHAGQVRVVQQSNGVTAVQASTDADDAAELSILLSGTLSLSAGDFIL